MALLSLGACGFGAGQTLRYDQAARNGQGTIAISDPKLYTRENLINERARDVAWFDQLIANSEDPTKVAFKPALIRELETLSAVSAALGFKADPASAINFRRDAQTSAVQQEIDVLRAQFQLEQLRRDLEILRAKLPEQSEPVNAGLGTLGTGSAATLSSDVKPNDTARIVTEVGALITSLTGRLAATSPAIGRTDVTSSPLEDLRDRLSYRDALKAARNAAGHDELHDLMSNRLLRLNFQATVLPDSSNIRSLAAIQVKVANQAASPGGRFLQSWLHYINTSPNFASGSGRAMLDELSADGHLEPVGLAGVTAYLPTLNDPRNSSPQNLLWRADWSRPDGEDRQRFQRRLALVSGTDSALVDAALTAFCDPNARSELRDELNFAEARLQSHALISALDMIAETKGARPIGDAVGAKRERAQSLIATLRSLTAQRQGCAAAQAYFGASEPVWRLTQQPEFTAATRVHIYEVGPKEQVQQVSTAARSASSLALAASIAASAPASGVAADLGAGYRRDAMARASALERVPELVGYSVGGQNTFGWVIGPKATITTRGRAVLEQVLRPYDLSVDLAVPSWWSGLDLEITTVWAPSPAQLTSGALHRAGDGETVNVQPRTLHVALPAVGADFEEFTKLLVRERSRTPIISSISGGPINACGPTTLLVRGQHLWRAQRILLLGAALDRSAFTVAPDMNGLLVTVPAVQPTTGDAMFKKDPNLHVLTPFGPASHVIDYVSAPSGDACKPPKAAADTTSVTISTVTPDGINVPSAPRLEITGINLNTVDAVTLAAQPGTIIEKADDGKSLAVVFTRDATSSIEVGRAKLELFVKRKSVANKDIRTIKP